MRENVASEVPGIYLAMEHNRKELARAGNAAGRKECRRLKQRRCAEREGAARFAPCFCSSWLFSEPPANLRARGIAVRESGERMKKG